MKDLNEATEKICQLFGMVMAQECVTLALLRSLPPPARSRAWAELLKEAEAARIVLLNSQVSEFAVAAFEERLQVLEKLCAAPLARLDADR